MGGLQIAPSGEREKKNFLADEVTNFLRKMANPLLYLAHEWNAEYSLQIITHENGKYLINF